MKYFKIFFAVNYFRYATAYKTVSHKKYFHSILAVTLPIVYKARLFVQKSRKYNLSSEDVYPCKKFSQCPLAAVM